jgi:hypothetical protein
MSQKAMQVFNWFFQSRQSHKITIVQIPNVPLAIFFIASYAHVFVSMSASAHTVLADGAAGALLFWAGDEVLRGVNPWRRILGGGVFLIQIGHAFGPKRWCLECALQSPPMSVGGSTTVTFDLNPFAAGNYARKARGSPTAFT